MRLGGDVMSQAAIPIVGRTHASEQLLILRGHPATTRVRRIHRAGHVILIESGGPAELLVPTVTEALKSHLLDGEILPVLSRWKASAGISFTATARALYENLDREEANRLTRLLGLVGSHARSMTDLLLKTRFQAQTADRYCVIAVTPNLAIDAYLASGRLYPGGAAGTLGSVLAGCKVSTAVCGFLTSGPSGALFATLAREKGIDTKWLTPIYGDCGFTVFPSATEKLSRLGPTVTSEERAALIETVRHLLTVSDPSEPPLVILSGTVPRCDTDNDDDLYYELIHMIRQEQHALQAKSKIWVDARGRCLLKSVIAQPDYVKINRDEFLDLIEQLVAEGRAPRDLRTPCHDRQSLADKARRLIEELGIPSMTITLGQDGALQVWRGSDYALAARTCGHSPGFIAGLGDTLLAFQAVGEVTGAEIARRVEFGVAAALVSSRKEGTDLANNLQEVEPVVDSVIREVLTARTGAQQPPSVIGFLRGLLKRGAEPVVVADMDGTLTVAQGCASVGVLNAILGLLGSGVTFALLTSASLSAATRQVVAGLQSKGAAAELANLYVLPTQGGQAYRYDVSSGSFNLLFAVDLRDASVLGPTKLLEIRSVLSETSLMFCLPGVLDELVEDRGSQITLMTLGLNASAPQKNEYERGGGRIRRTEIAAFINRRFRQLRIPARACVAGKSSIDIAPRNIHKGFGLTKLADILNVDQSTILFIGNDFDDRGSDWPAAWIAGLAVNVGPSILDERLRRPLVVESRRLGPQGTTEILTQIVNFRRRAARSEFAASSHPYHSGVQ